MSAGRGRGRRRRGARRAWLPSWSAAAVIVALCVIVWSSVQQHRLDRLRQRHVQLTEQLRAEEVALDRARMEYARNASYDSVVPRAQVELGLVESNWDQRRFVALPPHEHPVQGESFGERLARGLDRFSSIRGAFAAEEQR